MPFPLKGLFFKTFCSCNKYQKIVSQCVCCYQSGLIVTNMLAYYPLQYITTAKSFLRSCPWVETSVSRSFSKEVWYWKECCQFHLCNSVLNEILKIWTKQWKPFCHYHFLSQSKWQDSNPWSSEYNLSVLPLCY